MSRTLTAVFLASMAPLCVEAQIIPTTREPVVKPAIPIATTTAVVNPAAVQAVQKGNSVVVTWSAVPGATSYLILGKTSADFREIPAPATTTTYTGLAQGSYTYAVGAKFDPGARQTPPAQWPSASVNVVMTSGRYRLTLTGARVVRQTTDDPLNLDGWGDEVSFLTYTEVFDRPSGNRTQMNIGRKTMIYGDVNVNANRIKAGTASANGGLRTGDVLPAGTDPSRPTSAPLLDRALPYRIYDGTMTDGKDAWLVHTAIEESDPFVGKIDFPSTTYSPMDSYINPKLECPPAKRLASPEVQNEMASVRTLNGVVQRAVTTFGGASCDIPVQLGQRADGSEVIGNVQGNTEKTHNVRDWFLVLTREKIEAALGANRVVVAPMTIRDEVKGGDGIYTVYIQIERVP